jgi:tetratricopeptide (TPR) repeat protein
MMPKRSAVFYLFSFLCFVAAWPLSTFGQRTSALIQPTERLSEAIAQYDQGQYRVVLSLLDPVNNRMSHAAHFDGWTTTDLFQARVYAALSRARLGWPGSQALIEQLYDELQGTFEADRVRLQLMQYRHRAQKYSEVIALSKEVQWPRMPKNEREQGNFLRGYALWKKGDPQSARDLLEPVATSSSPEAPLAALAMGGLCDEAGLYEQALVFLDPLRTHPSCSLYVPALLARLYYRMERFEDLFAYALPLSARTDLEQADQLNHIIAQAYFAQGEYAPFLTYMERYKKLGGRLSPDDHFRIGFSSYSLGDPQQAIESLQRATNGMDDNLSHRAFFLMGEASIQLGRSQEALAAFYTASRRNGTAEMNELSAFRYAQLCCRLKMNNQALSELKDFLKKYPHSIYSEEAKALLSGQLLVGKNFREALEVFRSLKQADASQRLIWQRAALYRAMQLYHEGSFSSAEQHFNEALELASGVDVTRRAHYWRGETRFRLQKFAQAADDYKAYLNLRKAAPDGTESQENAALAYYGLAYAYFRLDEFRLAEDYFRRVVAAPASEWSNAPGEEGRKSLVADARIRRADALFALKQYNDAFNVYGECQKHGGNRVDYPAYQQAILQGLMGRQADKILSLERFLARHRGSEFWETAVLELMGASHNEGLPSKSLAYADTLERVKPASQLMPSAWLIKGLILYQQDQVQAAIDQYTRLLSQFPQSPQASEALATLRVIYAEQNRPDDYLEMRNDLGLGTPADSEMDTLRFQSAEQAYNRGDCVRARKEVGEYLSNYPNGSFHLYARLIRAQCARSLNQRKLMYEDLEDLVARPSHPYTESVLRMLAEERAADSSWQQSAEAWKKWGSRMTAPQDIQEALKGQMTAWVNLENWTELEKVASRILEMESIPEALRTDAQIAKALCLMEASQLSDAQAILEKVYASNKNEPGATALYYLADIAYRKGNYALCQSRVFEMADRIPYYDHWLGMAFLLLSDSYVAQKNTIQARATLESVAQGDAPNYIRAEARNRLNQLSAQN